MSAFQLFGLPSSAFAQLGGLDPVELAAQGVHRIKADTAPGYPCRVSLVDAEVGEELFLLPYAHHDVDSPYRSSGPIFVRVQATDRQWAPGEVPTCVQSRLMSLRAYDKQHLMLSGQVCDGVDVARALEQLFEAHEVAYVQLHNAKPGCFSCEARRVASV